MQIMITDLSLYAKTILEQHSSWTVHSVYRKTINLQSGDLLLALQAAGSPLSPISLITDLSEAGMDALKAVPGMEIPVGIVMAVCGGPFFLYLLRKKGKASGN